jgi:RNA polymerase sigma-70 factor (ECF subfamily)
VRDRAKPQPAAGSPHDPDRELLARAVQGDEAAVRDLFRRHVDKLYRQAARVLGADDADVEDVVQQAFLAALSGGAKFDGRSSVATWLFGITTRRALDAARSRWRRQRWNRLAEGFGLAQQAPAPDRGLELQSEAEAMLAGLVPEQRLVFLLHDVEGYTFAEIAGMTGIGISSLHARLVSARKKLDRLAEERGQVSERGEDD